MVSLKVHPKHERNLKKGAYLEKNCECSILDYNLAHKKYIKFSKKLYHHKGLQLRLKGIEIV